MLNAKKEFEFDPNIFCDRGAIAILHEMPIGNGSYLFQNLWENDKTLIEITSDIAHWKDSWDACLA